MLTMHTGDGVSKGQTTSCKKWPVFKTCQMTSWWSLTGITVLSQTSIAVLTTKKREAQTTDNLLVDQMEKKTPGPGGSQG